MDTLGLKAFLQVAEHRSFSKAAEQLFLTQPAISKRIKQLEQELGTPLLDRIGRQVSLTEAGRLLLPRARQLLIDMDDAKRSVINLTGNVSGTLSLGISHHLGLHRLPPILQNFRQAYPEVALDIQFLDSEVAYKQVLSGEIELGVITLAERPSEQVKVVPVWEDPLVFMAAKGHPLTALASPSLKDLARYEAILPSLDTFTGRITEQLFKEKGLSLNVSMATNYLETIKTMTAIGLGWSLLPSILMDDSVNAIKIKGVNLKRRLGAIYHTHRTLSNAAEAFISQMTCGIKQDIFHSSTTHCGHKKPRS